MAFILVRRSRPVRPNGEPPVEGLIASSLVMLLVFAVAIGLLYLPAVLGLAK